MKKQVTRDHFKRSRNSKELITVSCENLNGYLVTKNIAVVDRRIIRYIGGQPIVITPVTQNRHIVGYAIEGKEKFDEILSGRRKEGIGHRNRPTLQRNPNLVREIYELGLLPDGMFVCSDCGNFVKKGHKCK